jgi:lipopolysaccharide assembly outer membrane protein LptD (OstA)
LVPKLQTKHRLITIFLILSVLISVQARIYLPGNIPAIEVSNMIASPLDTLLPVVADSFSLNKTDTLNINDDNPVIVSADTVRAEEKANKFMLSAKIDYASADSLSMDIKKKMAWMYGNASIEYEDIKLKAALITIDFDKNIIHAYASKDSAGNAIGIPEFTQGSLSFKSKEIAYNFTTHKGLIQNVITKEGEGYLHGSVIKKVNDSVTNVGKGEYTTCDLEDHPHFSLKYTKAKVLSGNMIVTGPAYMTIEGVPLPLALPFGMFPNRKGRSSGLIIPKYGESANRGFFLEDGGYYFGLNDYFDLRFTGDIYSRGSWALKPALSYKKRYKFSGNFSLKYAVTVLGTEGSSDYSKKSDFFVNWSHRQDPKARPNSVFSASVQAGSSNFNKYNPASVNDYVSNTFSSSISYDIRLGSWGNLTAAAMESQNTSTKTVNLTLPQVSFGINRIYPFKRKIQTGPAAWYESVNVTYNMNARNVLNTYDSLVFKSDVVDRFSNGVQNIIPISGSFKIFKYFSWSNSINYNENWYTKTIRETWVGDTIYTNGLPKYGYVDIDTVNGFKAARFYTFSSSVSTTLYGMKQFKKGPIRAIRHVVRPSVGFSYVPDFGSPELGYWRTVQTDASGKTKQYSIFGDVGTITPIYSPPPSQKSGSINFSLSNNLEMKVRSLKDTVTGTKKVMLIDNFSISTSYDIAKDSLRWSDIILSARTTLFKKIQISYASAYSPYGLYSQPFYGFTMIDYYSNPFYTPVPGPKINTSQYSMNNKLLRFISAGWNLSVGYDLKPKKKEKDKKIKPGSASDEEMEDIQNNSQLYIDWDNPWSLRFDYNFRYTSVPVLATGDIKRDIIQTLRVAGDVNVTQKWKVSAQTGYDFEQKAFAFTQLTIYRNLHCWEMRLSWIPYGTQKSWNFQINAKSSLLQDLKLTRKKDFRDNL